MRSVLALTTTEWLALGGPAAGATIALLGVAFNLLLSGTRAERERRRALHARALEAIIAYGEMPFRIRRRAPGPQARATLSDDLSRVKAEVEICRVLLAADGDDRLASAYDQLYDLARRTVGTEAHLAWQAPVIERDEDMNMGELFRSLAPFQARRDAFADDLRRATLARRKRTLRWLRGRRINLCGSATPTLLEPPAQDVKGAEAPSASTVEDGERLLEPLEQPRQA